MTATTKQCISAVWPYPCSPINWLSPYKKTTLISSWSLLSKKKNLDEKPQNVWKTWFLTKFSVNIRAKHASILKMGLFLMSELRQYAIIWDPLRLMSRYERLAAKQLSGLQLHFKNWAFHVCSDSLFPWDSRIAAAKAYFPHIPAQLKRDHETTSRIRRKLSDDSPLQSSMREHDKGLQSPAAKEEDEDEEEVEVRGWGRGRSESCAGYKGSILLILQQRQRRHRRARRRRRLPPRLQAVFSVSASISRRPKKRIWKQKKKGDIKR